MKKVIFFKKKIDFFFKKNPKQTGPKCNAHIPINYFYI